MSVIVQGDKRTSPLAGVVIALTTAGAIETHTVGVTVGELTDIVGTHPSAEDVLYVKRIVDEMIQEFIERLDERLAVEGYKGGYV